MATWEAKQEGPLFALNRYIETWLVPTVTVILWNFDPGADLNCTTAYHAPESRDRLFRLLTWTTTEEQETQEETKNIWHIKPLLKCRGWRGASCRIPQWVSLSWCNPVFGKPPGKNWCGKGLTEQVCVLASSLWENMALRDLGHRQDLI